jgi:arylsulfatase A-like enzyme
MSKNRAFASQAAQLPNIVFFFTDDQRFDTIHALGNEQIITPNIDRLVKEGVTFTHGHIPCGTSGAVCMPSRAMLHSGRTLFHLEGEGQSIPPEHTTLGETLQKAGYRTFGTGKWHNGAPAYARSFTDGGEIYFGGMWDHWNVPVYDYDSTGKYDNWANWCKEPFESKQLRRVKANHVTLGKHSSELFADVTIDFIKNYDDDKPFFTYTSFMAPHDPRTMPEEFLNLYNPAEIELPVNFSPRHSFDYNNFDVRDELLAPYPRTPEDTKQQLAEYYGMISHLDNEIGRIMKSVEEKGVYENTIFVFAGDNGLALGQHGLFGKQSVYEHSIRVPLIFAGPGIPAGETRDAYAYLLDIYPTLCDMLKIQTPDTVEGFSQLSVIKGEKKTVRETLYFGYTDKIRACKDNQYKLAEYVHNNHRLLQLFDLKNDPWEMKNLASDPAFGDKIKEMTALLEKLRDEWDDKKHPMGEEFWRNRNEAEYTVFLS